MTKEKMINALNKASEFIDNENSLKTLIDEFSIEELAEIDEINSNPCLNYKGDFDSLNDYA